METEEPSSSLPPSRLTLTKKQKTALITLGILLLIGLFGYAIFSFHRQTKVTSCSNCRPTPTPTLASPTPKPTPEIKKVAAWLNGVLVPEGTENMHPLAVMIENHPDARPQSGLGQADLVYEAIAEGGITRFMAVYANPSLPIKVGPIRSARTYYVDLATELNAFYAHVGGNMDALDQISATPVLDLNQFSIGEPVYKREFTRPVALEHTMYSSTEKLWNYATETKQWSKTGNYQPWLFQDDAVLEQRPASQKITVSVSDSLYDVSWIYDKASNSYLREMAGTPHLDANTGKQISVKNVVLQTVNRRPTTTRINEQGWIYTLTGSGPATIIQNGTTIKGTWKKEGTNRTRFYNASGAEIKFVRGTTWVHLIHPDSRVTD